MNIKREEKICHSHQQVVALSVSPDKVSTTDDTIIQWDNKNATTQDSCHSGAHQQVDNT